MNYKHLSPVPMLSLQEPQGQAQELGIDAKDAGIVWGEREGGVR